MRIVFRFCLCIDNITSHCPLSPILCPTVAIPNVEPENGNIHVVSTEELGKLTEEYIPSMLLVLRPPANP